MSVSHSPTQSSARKALSQSLENIRLLEAQARAAVLDARRQAAQIVAQARQEAQAVRHQAGLSPQPPAQATHGEDLKELTHLLGQIARELTTLRDQARQSIRREGARLGRHMAELIVGQVAQRDISVAQSNLERALRLVRREGPIRVLVNPRQLSQLRRDCPCVVGELGLTGLVQLVGCEDITPGGVRVDSASGQIDATLEGQLAAVGQAVANSAGHYAAAS